MSLRDQLQKTLGTAYVIERELGGGGMSRVFLAEDTALGRKVVVKVLPPELTAGVNVERFNREILLAAKLQHPHIVPVHTAGAMDGLPWFTMPFVDGESLRARLERGTALPITETVGLLRDVAKALAYAHEHGIVHRDIKPDNVLLTGGSATVADFGIAKAISASRTVGETQGLTQGLTQVGTSIGTPAYMSPEQAAGDPETDHRADLYSFGCLAYEMLAGRPPFIEKSPRKLLAAHMGEKPQPVSELRPDTPAALAELVMRCLEKEADARPQQARDLVRALETVTTGEGSQQTMPAVLLAGRGMLRKALAIWTLALGAVALLAQAAIVGIGLPTWVLPGALLVMALGLPVILWTAYVHRVARRAYMSTPTYTPGGTPALAQGTMATIALKASPHMSWHRTARGGAMALGGFAVLVIGYMVMRAMGIGAVGSLIGKGTFGQNETVIVADFRSPASDSTLGVTVSEALRTDLAQSKNLKVLTKAAVAEVLRLMQRPADASVPFTLAREVASREGAKAVLDGDIVELGGNYVISARLVGALDGAELATFRRTARNQGELVEVLGELSKDIRSKVGESLREVRESIPLERVSTTSLPALRKYVEGVQMIATTGDNAKGRDLLLQAVALDSTFAMAWRRIAASYSSDPGSRAAQTAASTKAYEYRERLSESERLLTEAYYWSSGPTPDREKTIAAYEALIERDSMNRSATNNVAISYWQMRDRAKAEASYRRAISVAQPFGGSFVGLLQVQVEQGKIAAAESTLALFEKKLPAHGDIPGSRAVIALARGDVAAADSILRNSLPTLRSDDARRTTALAMSNVLTARGRVREGMKWTAQSIPAAGSPAMLNAGRLGVMLDSAWVQAYYLDDAVAAKATVRRALERIPINSLAAPDRPWGFLLSIATVTRDAAAARTYAAALQRDIASSPFSTFRGAIPVNRAMLALAENRAQEAAALFAEADETDLGPEQIGPWRAHALDLANQPDSAIIEFERFVAFRDPTYSIDRDFLAGSHKRLGELYEAAGNVPKAIEHYEKFVELWKDADPELQPKVRAARTRLDALRRKGTQG